MQYIKILSLSLLLLFLFCTFSSAAQDKSSAIILSISGNACIQKITKCTHLKIGQNLYEFDRIKIKSGAIWIYTFHRRKKELIKVGEHTLPKVIPTTNSKKYAKSRLEALAKISKRTTAAALFRSTQYKACPKSNAISVHPVLKDSCKQSLNLEQITVDSTASKINLPPYSYYVDVPTVNPHNWRTYSILSTNACTPFTIEKLKQIAKTEWTNENPIYLVNRDQTYVLARLPSSCSKNMQKELDLIDSSLLEKNEKHIAKQTIFIEFGLLKQATEELLRVVE